MLSARALLRNSLTVCIAAIIGLVVSVAVAAEEGDFPLVFASMAQVQSGPNVQSASGVITTLHRLALEEGYTDAEADALVAALRVLLDSNVPPGTILHVSRELLSDLSAADLLTTLEELGQLIDGGMPPGQAANQILERGNGNSGSGNGNSGDNGGGGNGNGDSGDNGGGGNGNGNSGDNGGGGNGNGNSGDNGGGGNGNGNGNGANGNNGNGNNGGGNNN